MHLYLLLAWHCARGNCLSSSPTAGPSCRPYVHTRTACPLRSSTAIPPPQHFDAIGMMRTAARIFARAAVRSIRSAALRPGARQQPAVTFSTASPPASAELQAWTDRNSMGMRLYEAGRLSEAHNFFVAALTGLGKAGAYHPDLLLARAATMANLVCWLISAAWRQLTHCCCRLPRALQANCKRELLREKGGEVDTAAVREAGEVLIAAGIVSILRALTPATAVRCRSATGGAALWARARAVCDDCFTHAVAACLAVTVLACSVARILRELALLLEHVKDYEGMVNGARVCWRALRVADLHSQRSLRNTRCTAARCTRCAQWPRAP